MDIIPMNDIYALITRRRWQILIHSIIYYRMNESIISDWQWTQWAKELADLQHQYPDISSQAPLYEYFKGFEGDSGCDLPLDNPYFVAKAIYINDICKINRRNILNGK